MDAYVFARTATADAVGTLTSAAGDQGGIRVVCPLDGEQRLYVALAAPDPETLRRLVDEVTSLSGLAEPTAYFAPAEADPRRAGFPTYAAVAAFVAFAVYESSDPLGDALLGSVRDLPLVVGATALDEGERLLAEASAGTPDEARDALRRVGDLPGLRTTFVAAGEVSGGTGLRTT